VTPLTKEDIVPLLGTEHSTEDAYENKRLLIEAFFARDVLSAVEGLKKELCGCYADDRSESPECYKCQAIDKWFPAFVSYDTQVFKNVEVSQHPNSCSSVLPSSPGGKTPHSFSGSQLSENTVRERNSPSVEEKDGSLLLWSRLHWLAGYFSTHDAGKEADELVAVVKKLHELSLSLPDGLAYKPYDIERLKSGDAVHTPLSDGSEQTSTNFYMEFLAYIYKKYPDIYAECNEEFLSQPSSESSRECDSDAHEEGLRQCGDTGELSKEALTSSRATSNDVKDAPRKGNCPVCKSTELCDHTGFIDSEKAWYCKTCHCDFYDKEVQR